MAVYCKTDTEHSRTLCGQNADSLMLNLLGKCPYRKDVRSKRYLGLRQICAPGEPGVGHPVFWWVQRNIYIYIYMATIAQSV